MVTPAILKCEPLVKSILVLLSTCDSFDHPRLQEALPSYGLRPIMSPSEEDSGPLVD